MIQAVYIYNAEFKQYFPVAASIPNQKLQLDFLISVYNQIPIKLLEQTTFWNYLGIEVMEEFVLVYDILLLKYVKDEHEKVLVIKKANYTQLVEQWKALMLNPVKYLIVQQDEQENLSFVVKEELNEKDMQIVDQDRLQYKKEMYNPTFFMKIKDKIMGFFG